MLEHAPSELGQWVACLAGYHATHDTSSSATTSRSDVCSKLQFATELCAELKNWSGREDSNLRPRRPERRALPTAPRPDRRTAIVAGDPRRVQPSARAENMRNPEGTAAIVEVISDRQLPLRDAVSMPDEGAAAQAQLSTSSRPMRRVIHTGPTPGTPRVVIGANGRCPTAHCSGVRRPGQIASDSIPTE